MRERIRALLDGLRHSAGNSVASRIAPGRRGAPAARAQAMPAVTRCAPHVRDAVNLRWAMNCVVLALVPSILIGLYNTGLQANLAMARLEIDSAPGWRGFVIDTLRAGYDPSDILAAFLHGALYFVPVLVVALVVGGLWERLFAKLRNRGTAEGLTVIALLFSLSLPPVVPLWQVVLGMSFGIVVGKEIFGGTGKNFLNPAVTGLVFLYASYPQQVVGDTVWRAVDAFTGPTRLLAAEAVGKEGIAWLDTVSFLGLVPGAMGASSVFACLLGAAVLIYKRVASPRILAGVFIGVIGAVVLFNRLGGNSDPFFELPWYWHMTTGSLAFGAVFLATDPVSAASTDPGRWIYGLFVGIMVVVIRVANPAHPDGVLFAILLGNIFAPLIDYIVVRANIRRRARRSG